MNLGSYNMLDILVVDDSIIIRKAIKKYVTSLGHNIAGEAKTGIEAVSLCKELQPDLITMDITMPDMNGISAVKNILDFNQDVKIIMVTSHGQEEIVVDSLKAGAKGYILKPVSEDKLAKLIGDVFPDFAVVSEFDEELLDD